MRLRTIVILALLLVVTTGLAGHASSAANLEAEQDSNQLVAGGRLPIQGEGGIGAAERDFSGDLIQVLERDAIQSLDHPTTVSAGELRVGTYGPDEELIGVTLGGEARAYPLRILAPHEIVNDTLAGQPIVVTFCPLCYTGIVFDRTIDEEERTFGVSGILLNSDLVMYDHQNESLWAQLLGEAIAGPDTGSRLERIPMVQTTWKLWLAEYPETSVLDLNELGGAERYPADRFASYYDSRQSGLVPLRSRNDLEPKDLVLGFQIENGAIAYALAPLAGSVVNDRISNHPIAVAVDDSARGGRIFSRTLDGVEVELELDSQSSDVLIDPATGYRWSTISGEALNAPADLTLLDSTVSFWFGWATFFPDTSLYEPSP